MGMKGLTIIQQHEKLCNFMIFPNPSSPLILVWTNTGLSSDNTILLLGLVSLYKMLSCFVQTPPNPPFFSFFGPLTENGYGVGYKMYSDHIKLAITSLRDCAETDSRKFADCLETSYLELRDFCLKQKTG